MSRSIRRSLCLLAAAATLQPALTLAETYPSEKISVVVPYSTGNGLDLLGREFAELLQRQLKVPVIVENRDGAAGVIGSQYVMRAAPNGYTLLFTANPPFATSPYALDKAPYDPRSSFVPVARVGSVPLVLVTASKWQVRNIAQLKDFVQKNPNSASYASAGIGSPGQIYGELLNQAAGLQLREVRYKATGQALTDVIAGNVLVSLVSLPAAAQQIKAGSLTALGMGSSQRIGDFKDVPTLSEALGQKDFRAGVWYAFFAPAGMPADRVERIYADIAKAAESPQMHDFMKRQYMVPDLMNPAAFAESLKSEAEVSRKLVEEAKVRSH